MATRSFWAGISAFRRERTLAVLATLAGLFIVIGLSISLPVVQQWDLRFTREIQETSWTPLDQIMYVGTFLGSSTVIICLAIVLSVVMFLYRLRKMGAFVLATLVSLPIDLFLKHLWGRDRPNPIAVHVLLPTSGTSFPSGHVLGTTAFYGFLAILAWIHLPNKHGRLPLAVILAAMIPYVAISRIYVGAHWLSDVIGALAIGLIILVAFVSIYRADPEEARKAAATATNLTPAPGETTAPH